MSVPVSLIWDHTILHELPTESAFNTEMPMANIVVERRRNFHDLVVLYVQRQGATYATIRTDRVRLGLRAFIPGPILPALVFTAEHQRASGAHTDAIPAIHTS